MGSHIITFQPKSAAKYRLFCFPYAGASAAVYRPWAKLLGDNIELCAVEIPGRIQLKDKLADDMDELIEAIYPEIVELLTTDYILFGHSYGSVVAFELAKRLQKDNKKLAKQLYVSSRRAAHLPLDKPTTYQLSDQQFIEAMINEYNAIPEVILNEKEILQLLLPILKADIRLNETYVGSSEPKLHIPITVMYGEEDHTNSVSQLEKWCELTDAGCSVKKFKGGHFFIDSEKEAVIKCLTTLAV